ncbi:TetR/AcrR family transcriptional regulator [Kutzneria kofuensis]|uniref:AcrR family transcriptional regulator n=1 Tax=Kutzneria kofuensis TaxID=103725 RepID=A0A7W9NEF3_9PSEU|nr:TetR/AcrR family transcriptional regulator [Kutzneria kofuensis]MBB5890257.1 AcrR family transcriptional regulator [Kutzneria kofuensis]
MNTRRSGYHHGDLRNALETAALELVAERGAHGFTMAEASRRAQVSVAAPFKHFANREALLAALVLKAHDEQARRFAEAVGSTADPVEQLAEFAAAYVQFTVDEPALSELIFGAGIDKSAYPELAAAGGKVLDVLMAPAQALSPDALALVHTIGAMAHGCAAFLRERVFDSPETAKASARAAARALARAR